MADSGGSVRVSFPPEFELRKTMLPSRPLRRAGMAASQGAGTSETDAVLDGLERSNFIVVRDVTAVPAAAIPLRRGRGAAAATVAVDLAPNEDAVVLLEQDGVYSWKTDYAESQASRRRRGITRRTVTFNIPIETRLARTRSLGSVLFGPIRTIVMKFIARWAAGTIADHLEAGIHRGLVRIGGTNLNDWTDIPTLTGLGLEQKEEVRILLFLHGTFSSTRGSFGALVDSEWGKAFIDAALKDYDAIVGFDHPTLREDPRQNAHELLGSLRAVAWKQPPRIDVVTFSRGGLVYRTLVEELLLGDAFQAKFERSIFVAVPNAGTHLADPENWRDLIDLYTNLSAAVFRVVKLFPQAQTAAFVLSEAIAIIGSLVKSLTDPDVVGDKVPGLAAMSPDGEFIAKLNEVSNSGPSIDSTYYCYVTSDFEAEAEGLSPQEIPPKLWMRLADGFVDRLLKSETSDLVIDTRSVPQIDVQAGRYMKEWYEFPANSYVYHTNYFTRPEVADSLMKWLRLGSVRTTVVAPGAVVAPAIPAGFDSDVLFAAGEDSTASLRERIEEEAPSYVVVRRWYNDQTYHYAVPAEEALKRLNDAGDAVSIREALDLRETNRSRRATDVFHIVPTKAGGSEEREILFAHGDPIAVKSEVFAGADDVSKIAYKIFNPVTTGDRILRRRVLPSSMVMLKYPAIRDEGTSPRRTRRGMRAPARGAKTRDTETPPAPSGPLYHFLAQIDSTVVRAKPATIDVTVSRSVLIARAGAVAAGGSTTISPEHKLVLEVFARRNFVIDGNSRIDIEVASLTEPRTFFFDVKGTDTGEGEVWVLARQGQTPLLTLVLKTTIVEALTQPAGRTQADAVAATADQAPPFHKLTIRESERGKDTYLNFELEAPALNLYDQFESTKPLSISREAYVRKLYVEIESFWAQNIDDAERFVDELRAYGTSLYDELIPLELQRALWQHRDELRSIMVVSTEPFLPWEVLYLHEPGEAITPDGRFFGQMGLVRWLYGNWPPVKLQIRKERARYIAPNYPPPDTLLNAQKDASYLAQKFGATAVPPRYSEVKALLATADGFDLLHFACHGESDPEKIDTRLLLECGDLKSSVVASFARFGAKGNRPIIVLNACQVGEQRNGLTTFGGFAKAFLSRHAGVFVAPLWSVGDREATLFSRELYEALQRGLTLSEATTVARELTLKEGEDATWLAYAVYGHPHARCQVER